MLALLIAFVTLIALQRVLELLLSRRYERALRAKGAYERGAGHYPLIVGLHAGWLVSMLLEGWVRGGGAFGPVAALARPVRGRAGAALLGHPEPRRALDNAPHHPARNPSH